MKQYLLKKEDYFNTFTENQKKSIDDYSKAKRFIKKGIGITEMSKKTGISISRLGNWIRKEKRIPFSYKNLQKAQQRNYFKIDFVRILNFQITYFSSIF